MTTVVNLKDGRPAGVIDVGRGSGLLGEGGWGNPFSHKPSRIEGVIACKTREQAIEAYRLMLWAMLEEGRNASLLSELAALHGQTLGCWCKPQACHADVLARAAAWAAGQINE